MRFSFRTLLSTALFALLLTEGATAQMAIEPQLSASDAKVIRVPDEEMPATEDDPDSQVPETMEEPANPAKEEPKAEEPPPAAAPPGEEPSEESFSAVRLQGLNKVTARISTFEAPLGTSMRFGNLEIVAQVCWKSPPMEKPENAALLKIFELKPGEMPAQIFYGWMFSSSPAISALEHPVYDITVLECVQTGNPD